MWPRQSDSLQVKLSVVPRTLKAVFAIVLQFGCDLALLSRRVEGFGCFLTVQTSCSVVQFSQAYHLCILKCDSITRNIVVGIKLLILNIFSIFI